MIASVVAAGFVLAPIAGVIPREATAAALVLGGYLMCTRVREIQFGDLDEGSPALRTTMPFTYSITGVGTGSVGYTFIKLVGARAARCTR
jgi:AGZA family xanthine/uracil permease-like MFS transporter